MEDSTRKAIAATQVSDDDTGDAHNCIDVATAMLNRPARLYDVMRQSSELDGGLLDVLDASGSDRVLIVGGTTADLLCASVRHGCRSAKGVARAPSHRGVAEIVLAPCVWSLEQAEEIARCARRAMLRGAHEGRLAVRFPGLGALDMARGFVARLKALGYMHVQLRRVGSRTVVVLGRFAVAVPVSRNRT